VRSTGHKATPQILFLAKNLPVQIASPGKIFTANFMTKTESNNRKSSLSSHDKNHNPLHLPNDCSTSVWPLDHFFKKIPFVFDFFQFLNNESD
jgi:hypothetical protein